MMAIDYSVLAIPKPTPHRRVKARRQRQASQVTRSIRAQCVDRDGYCLLGPVRPMAFAGYGVCEGPSEWAHIGQHRRSKTRGMAPERRHTTKGSAMLCQRHHHALDQHEFDLVPSDAAMGMNGDFQVVTRGKAHGR